MEGPFQAGSDRSFIERVWAPLTHTHTHTHHALPIRVWAIVTRLGTPEVPPTPPLQGSLSL